MCVCVFVVYAIRQRFSCSASSFVFFFRPFHFLPFPLIFLPLRYHYSELAKLVIEAKDNVKFLTTLERHFKNISMGDMNSIIDTLPSMMNAIRMVWIISRHYNTDERMVPLMERIAHEVAGKVAEVVQVRFAAYLQVSSNLTTTTSFPFVRCHPLSSIIFSIPGRAVICTDTDHMHFLLFATAAPPSLFLFCVLFCLHFFFPFFCSPFLSAPSLSMPCSRPHPSPFSSFILLQVPGILRCGTELSLSQIHLASRCLNSWSDTYRDVRDRIERSGNDHRWEFDRKLLFGRTVHMANICADLAEIAKVLDQFGAFLGPEVRRI